MTQRPSAIGGTLRVLDSGRADDRAAWLDLWRRSPEREVFAHPAYAALYTAPGVRARAAVLESALGCVLFPFLLRDLAREPWCGAAHSTASDVITPYGYGGAFAWGKADRQALAGAFWTRWEGWARATGIVSELVRLHVLAERLLPYPGDRTFKLNNVVRDLSPPAAAVWMEYRHKVRKNVNRACAEGVTVEVDHAGKRLDAFIELYVRTMQRRQAKETYFFERTFFESLLHELADGAVLFHALWRGGVVSSELVLVSARTIYSFLGGTDEDALAIRPNDLLKHRIIEWGREQGKEHFVLGGGLAPDDGIFRYKESFAPGGVVPFEVGWRIHDPAAYEDLVACRRRYEENRGGDWEARPDYFPAYRS